MVRPYCARPTASRTVYRLPCSIFPPPRVFYSKALTGLCGRLLQLDQSTSHPLTCKQRQAGESKPRYQLERTLPCKSRLGRANPVTNSSVFLLLQTILFLALSPLCPLPCSSSSYIDFCGESCTPAQSPAGPGGARLHCDTLNVRHVEHNSERKK